MTITAGLNETFTAMLDGAPAGLVGTLGVRIENQDGTNQTPRTTAGIVELEPGAGVYVKDDLVAPAVEGGYIVLWDDGVLFASEELTVRIGSGPSVPDDPDLAGNVLTNIAALSAFLDEPIEEGDPTSFAVRLINGYSQAIHRYTAREFLPATPPADSSPPVARRFEWDGSSFLSLAPYDLRSLGGAGYGGTGAVTAYTNKAGGSTVIAAGEYVLYPPGGTEEGTYTWLRLTAATAPYALGDEVTVAGYWGVNTVPADVEMACLMACELEWRREALRAQGEGAATEVEPDTATPARGGYWLPYEVRSLLFPYARGRPIPIA